MDACAPTSPFDPLLLSRRVSALVETQTCRRISRVGVAGASGGAVTLYVAGCNLRCSHCWADESRDDPVAHAAFMSPGQAAEKLQGFSRYDRMLRGSGIIRFSGGEPILSERSAGFIAGILSRTGGQVLIETNGIALGGIEGLAEELRQRARARLRVRLSLKAGWPESFEHLTGAKRWAHELPFQAIEILDRLGIPFDLNAVSLSPELMDPREREDLLKRLRGIRPGLIDLLQEEAFTPYPAAVARMRQASWVWGAGKHSPC